MLNARTKRDPWICGYAAALADEHRMHHRTSDVEDTLIGSNLTLHDLEQAGVEPYDLNEIRKCLPRGSRARRRTKKRGAR